ncbi:hypothetical protein MUG84_08675 [Paenibacillus sp. KQZ6P-2]|uniref:Uncharacterized protein n=1 Tax=Paenibacillus mangrovi TaxID=2931978 RepID=A0A9X1WPY1_9BACL|nr:hypothetical protein [Paenibacillus mangrovi]MCJ8011815.1 hypothetical protein [Paenibacillus mangrovi]
MNTMMPYREDLNDPMKLETFSEQFLETLEDGSTRVKPQAASELAFLFQNKWIGIPGYAQAYARDWVNVEEFVKQLSDDLDRVKTLEEATEAVLTHLRRWGRQAAGDFVGGFCFLEAQASLLGGNDEIISRIRATERAYAGYLERHEHQLKGSFPDGLNPGEAFYTAQPLFEEAPGFMQWLFGVVDVSLLNRRGLIADALHGKSFEEVLLRIMLASNGVIEEAAMFAAYVAQVLDLQRFYTLQVEVQPS